MLISAIIISFVIGYTTGFFIYTKQTQIYASNTSRFQTPEPKLPIQNRGPGSERFHNTTKSDEPEMKTPKTEDGIESMDNDDKILRRMKK